MSELMRRKAEVNSDHRASPSEEFIEATSPSDFNSNKLKNILAKPPKISPQAILGLQKTLGNRVVQRLLFNPTSLRSPLLKDNKARNSLNLDLNPVATSSPAVDAQVPVKTIQRKHTKYNAAALLDIPNLPANLIDHEIPTYKIDVGVKGKIVLNQGDEIKRLSGNIFTIPANWGEKPCRIHDLYQYHPRSGKYRQASGDFKYYVEIILDNPQIAFAKGANLKVGMAAPGNSTHAKQMVPIFNTDDDTPKISEIKQGKLGDCHLLASLISILSGPDGPNKIKSLFVDQSNSKEVTIKFFRPGTGWENVTISRRVTSRYADVSEVLWVGLLEKAFTKWGPPNVAVTTGSYSDIESSKGSTSLSYLTGLDENVRGMYKAPDNVAGKNITLYQKIEAALAEEGYVTLGTRANDATLDAEVVKALGDKKERHAHAVIGVEAPDKVITRNPWGDKRPDKPKGAAYNDQSQELIATNNAQSTIKIVDLRKYFDEVGFNLKNGSEIFIPLSATM